MDFMNEVNKIVTSEDSIVIEDIKNKGKSKFTL